MKDFLGNELSEGDYVAAGGRGNSSAEYGMILYRVEAVEPKLKIRRLTISYGPKVVKSRLVTATNSNKYVRVNPPARARTLFDKAVAGELKPSEADLIGKWLHGAECQVGLWDR